MKNAVERALDWAGLPVIATVARLLCPSTAEPWTATPIQEVGTCDQRARRRLRESCFPGEPAVTIVE